MKTFKVLLLTLTSLVCQLNILSMLEINSQIYSSDEISVIRQTDQYIIFYHTPNNQLTDTVILYLDEAALTEIKKEAPQSLDIIKCVCNSCGGRKKNDRFHTIPPIIEQFLPHAIQLTKNTIKNFSFHNNLEPKIALIRDEFALVLEARIINKNNFRNDKVDHNKILRWRNKKKRGHHHGAYVFIYKKDTKHCTHAMFHKHSD